MLGREEIKLAYGTGKGRLIMRAVTRIEEMSGRALTASSSPRSPTNSTRPPCWSASPNWCARVVSADISDLRDESDRKGMHIVIELKRGAAPRKVLNQLFKYTPLQSTFGVNMLALVDGEPRLLSLSAPWSTTSIIVSMSSSGAPTSCCARRASGRTSWKVCASRCSSWTR